jgi:hypothetical protein
MFELLQGLTVLEVAYEALQQQATLRETLKLLL